MKFVISIFLCFVIAIFSISTYSHNPEYQTNAAALATIVVPNAYAAVQGTGTFLGPLSNAQRTYQLLIDSTQVSGLVGQELTAITWRLLASASANWPTVNTTYANFDIYLSGSVAPPNRSFTFAQNIVGVQKQVRSGPLTITAGAFPFGGSPTTFGSNINFDSVYLYTGGHLLIEIRHSVSDGASASTDAILTSTSGYGTLFSACWASSYTATSTTTQGNFVVTKITSQTPTGIINHSGVIKEFSLKQNYPNPFNPVTTIDFSLNTSANVTLKIYDAAGSEVKTLYNNESLRAGTHSTMFDASELPSGVYFYTLFVDNSKIDTKKMLLVK